MSLSKLVIITAVLGLSLCAACGGGKSDEFVFELPDGFEDQIQLTDQSVEAIISEPENPGTVIIDDGEELRFRSWLLERTGGDDVDVDEITNTATYTILSGADNIEIVGDGRVRGIDPGTGAIEVSSGGNQCRLNFVVE